MSRPRNNSTDHIQKKLAQNQQKENNKPGKAIETQSYEDPNQIKKFERHSDLKGRGQAGVAGFYTPEDSHNEYLIKVDDPGTCLMEGFACFAEDMIPDSLKSSVNFAHAGKAKIDNEDEEVAVSIQPKLSGYTPWDVIISGNKRNPKTFISFEASNRENILASIDYMTDHAKDQLAMALFISELVGDESLHIGQFMIKTNEYDLITDITRINFGARERYSVVRDNIKDYSHQTSYSYSSSGQLGKDYISYYLTHPDIKARVMQLWMRHEIQTDSLSENYKNELIRQFNNLPKEKQQEALEGILKTINKDSKNKIETNNIEELSNQMSTIMESRVNTLKKSAKDLTDLSFVRLFNKLTLKNSDLNEVNYVNYQMTAFIKAITLEDMLSAYENMKHSLGKLVPSATAIEILTHMQAKFRWEYAYNDSSRNTLNTILLELNDLRIKHQILNELNHYKQHLPESAVEKINQVNNAINLLNRDLAKSASQRSCAATIIIPYQCHS